MTPRIIFLPGASGAAAFWRGVGERLPQGWGKQYLSWPGLGEEPVEPEIRGFTDLVDRAEAALGERATLAAQSMGGTVALALALRRPERIERLVLTATSGGLDMRGMAVQDWRPEYRRRFPRLTRISALVCQRCGFRRC
jgi:pimeloyl-ACP methyl ester carboxylesterase